MGRVSHVGLGRAGEELGDGQGFSGGIEGRNANVPKGLEALLLGCMLDHVFHRLWVAHPLGGVLWHVFVVVVVTRTILLLGAVGT